MVGKKGTIARRVNGWKSEEGTSMFAGDGPNLVTPLSAPMLGEVGLKTLVHGQWFRRCIYITSIEHTIAFSRVHGM
jgi:hypothetical protein